MIKAFIIINNLGKIRLLRFYNHMKEDEILDEITENIRINFVQSNSDSNLSLFIKEEIMSRFFAHTVSLEGQSGDGSVIEPKKP